MPQTIYASFADIAQAEKAAGALFDYGVQKDDLSLVVNGDTNQRQEQEVGTYVPVFADSGSTSGINYGISPSPVTFAAVYGETVIAEPRPTANWAAEDYRIDNNGDITNPPRDVLNTGAFRTHVGADGVDNVEEVAKSGITTTTAEDAGVGALKGTGIGIGLGILAGIASLIVPGVGLVVGGGALATAIGAAALTTGAGAITGGVVGYLKDQGVSENEAARYQRTIGEGGALLAVNIPSNGVDLQQAEIVLNKYGATDISSY